MSIAISRGTRVERPALPEGRIELEAPPELAPNEGISGALMMALPMLGSVGSIVFVASSGGGARGFIAAGMFLAATLGFVAVSVERQLKQRRSRITGTRREYLRYLATIRTKVRSVADEQRRVLAWIHPPPAALATLAEEGSRLWDRGSDHPDRLHVRYGTSTQPLAMELVPPPSAPVEQVDPVSASALHRLISVHRAQPDLPAAIDIGAFSRIELTGDVEHARGLARALVCQATAFHGPERLAVAVLAGDGDTEHWDWVKWLPHVLSERETDAIGARRMVTTSLDDLAALLPREVADRPRFGGEQPAEGPHVVLVVDGTTLPPGQQVIPDEGIHGVTLISLLDRPADLDDPTRLRLHLEPGRDGLALTATRLHHDPVRGVADHLTPAEAEAYARRLAPYGGQTDRPTPGTDSGTAPELTHLLGLQDIRDHTVEAGWRDRPVRDQLRVPIGVSSTGSPVHLDLKESAQQGMGPHGLVVGATGSGKSELLRTLVLGLALTHSSERLNMVLIDFKGGATFSGLADLPHVSAVITNLEQELPLVDRMQDALTGEMVRRQQLLRDAGNIASIRDYERARAAGAALDPIPSLFIVVDEFSELLTAKPDFVELFGAIGRLGRSLGLHLLLASQRLDEGRLRGLESHLSYRIGLRTFSSGDSRAVLGVPDAYELPSVPGLGYLKVDQDLVRFKAAYVSGPPPRAAAQAPAAGSATGSILPFTIEEVLSPVQAQPAVPVVLPQPTAEGGTTLDFAVAAMVGQGPQAHRVWLEPLDTPTTLDVLVPGPEDTDTGSSLLVPIGVLDRPREQRRDTFSVDLSGAGGHFVVVGGPRSGKSTALRTTIAGIALTSSPHDAQLYLLDLGGGAFAAMAGLPHVSGMATRSEPDVVHRMVAEITSIVDRREAYFHQHGVDSIETYRRLRRARQVDDGYGDVFLVVDGWGALRSDFEPLELALQNMAQRGLTYGVHVIASASRWTDLRSQIRDLFGSRLELRLGDPSDSDIDRKAAELVPAHRPGRGLVPGPLHVLTALPRVDGVADPASSNDGIADLVRRISAGWDGTGGPKLRLLPTRVSLERVREIADERDLTGGLLIGIDERDLKPVALDVGTEPHLVVYGDRRAGKSAFLRTYVQELRRTRGPERAKVIAIDYRRSLLGEIPDDLALEYVSGPAQIAPVVQGLATLLSARLPGPEVTIEQLRSRSWWTGPDAFLVVDDYDLVAPNTNASPLLPLLDLLPQAHDIGFHLVIARRSGGAGRAAFDPVLRTLNDLAQPGLLLSGSASEGTLVGTARPRAFPAGRAQLVTRDLDPEVVQLAWTPPSS